MAGVCALLLKEPFHYITRRFALKKEWASGFIIFLALTLITLPLTFMGVMISAEATEGYNLFRKNWPQIQNTFFNSDYINRLISYLESTPYIGESIVKLEGLDIASRVEQIISTGVEFLAKILRQAFLDTSALVLHVIVALYLVFFLLVDGQNFLKKVNACIPLAEKDKRELLDTITKMIKGVLYGTIVIGVAEGFYGGLLFVIFGIKAPFLWGSIMVLLSMIPLVGTNSVLVPVGIYFLLAGKYLSGILILVVGSGGILISQNIIRPKLVGDQSNMHPAIVVLSTLGGMAWLGLAGFLIGPLLAALFIAIWDQFSKKYQVKE